MRKYCYQFILVCFSVLANSQQAFNCLSHDFFVKQQESDPAFKKNQQQLEQETAAFQLNTAAKAQVAAQYIIPVVFHVIYTTPAGNISDAQIIDQIAILNKEFNRQQADTVLTPLPFKPLAAPFSVEFRLATLDPNGNCTNGINRIYNTLTNCSVYENDVKLLSYWPSNRYLNIWVTQSMHYSGSTTCDGGGYATFPGGAANMDGINIRGDLIGNIGTAATNTQWGNFKGRYLIHELGHWFNLRHIWGDATCGNDLVSDTPPAVASNNSCPTFPHNAFNQCGSGASGEMFTNYMDYTNGPCLNMFSAGQVTRMTAAINSNVSGRNNLWTTTNLQATGTNDPYTYPVPCAANPNVLANAPIVACVDDSVKITDNSYGGKIASRNWNFGGQGASSLTDSIVKVKYSTPGIYSFSLTSNYNNTSKTAAFNNKVYVLGNVPNTNYFVPFEDNLEDATTFSNEWVIVDHNNDGQTWEHNASTGYSGSACMSIANFNGPGPKIDEAISPAYDLRAVENSTLTFRLNFTARASNNSDELLVYISNTCGNTWQQIYSKVASGSLKTLPALQSVASFTPGAGSDDWRLERINLPALWSKGIVRFKFTFKSGGGNNIFIDDINVDGLNTVGIEQQSASGKLRLFPNPSAGFLNLQLDPASSGQPEITFFDLPGKMVLQQTPAANANNGLYTLDLRALENGVYSVRVKQNGTSTYSGKLVLMHEN